MVGEEVEVGRAARDVNVRGERDRLAGVGDLGLEELVEALVDAGGDLEQQLAALRHRHLAPRALERPARRLDRGVDIGLARLVDHADHRVVERGAVFESLAERPLGILAVDEIQDLAIAHERDSST